MNRRKSMFLVSVIIVILFFAYLFRNNFNKEDISKTYYDLNTVSEITLYNVDKSKGDKILNECGKILLQIDNTMSKTRDGSDISNINKASGKEYIKVSDDTFSVIEEAIDISKLSHGVFDISIGKIVDLWGIGTDKAHIPNSEEIKKLLPLVNYKNILLDNKTKSVKLKEEGMEIDLGGIAKGYAADKVYDYLKTQNIESAIINLGGNVFVMGEKSKNTPFTIGIQDPTTSETGNSIGSLEVSDKSVVTSGIYERFFKKDNKIYHHMINPSDGYPFDNNLSSVTIISSSSTLCDALSTTAYGLGLEKGLDLIENTDDVDAIFITKDKKIYTTSNLKNKFKLSDDSFNIVN